MDQALVAHLKAVTTTVVAVTALVTAISSLVKACDKRLEQASYETLAQSIHEVQQEQAALRADVLALNSIKDGDGIFDQADPLLCEMDAGVVDAGRYAMMVPSLPTSSASGVALVKPPPPLPKHPKYDGGLHDIAQVVVASPAVTGSRPPPKWDDVKARADSM